MTTYDAINREHHKDMPSHCRTVRPYSYGERVPSSTYGRWDNDSKGRWFVPEYLSGSDYSGSLVEQSNLRVFRETFEKGEGRWWVEVCGGHGTFGVIVRTLAYRNCTEVREFFDALEDYPLASEDDHSDLERTTMQEAWESDGREDFLREVKAYAKHVMGASYEEAIDAACEAVGEEQWDATWRDICDRSNVNGGTGWMNEQGDSIYFLTREAVWGCNAKTYPRREVGNFGFWDFQLEDGRDFSELVLAEEAKGAES